MKQRIITALCMLPLILFIYWGDIPLLCITFLLSVIAIYEFYKGFEQIGYKPSYVVAYISLACLYAIMIWGEYISENEPIVYAHLLCMWISGTVSIGLFIGLFRKGNPIEEGMIMIIADLYIGFFFAHIPLITRIFGFGNLVWLVFIVALGSDIFAYFVGTAIGKHKLCPDISPKKTVEGCIGGLVGASLLSIVFAAFVYPDLIIDCALIGFFGGAISQCGDLIASMFKRRMGIKDYGKIFPGHGGILDRFDSVLLLAPFIYYYILVNLRPTGFVSLIFR